MKTSIQRNNKIMSNFLSGVILVLAVSMFTGCGGHYGRLAASRDVEQQFENYQVLPDHRYYYSGSVARPRAVIGIHETYTLQSTLWVPVALTQDQLKAWVDYPDPSTKYFQGNNGAEILTEDGKRIGVWYALIDWRDWATVKMIDEHVVNISTPIIVEQKELIMPFPKEKIGRQR
jgi:hypothetical protein